MTNSDFDLAAALGTFDRPALDELLLESAAAGNLPAVDVILNVGANIDAKSHGGWTPLHCAAMNGHITMVGLLTARGATIDAKDGFDRTPLHYAASYGQTATVGQLIAKGAAVDAKDKGERKPWHLAASSGHTALAEQLRHHARKRPPIDPIGAARKTPQQG